MPTQIDYAKHAHWLSAARLLAANALVLAAALRWDWDALEIILVYWVQGAVIGMTQRLKIRDLVDYRLRVLKRRYESLRNPMFVPGIHNAFAVFYGLIWLVLGIAILVKYSIFTAGHLPINTVLLGSGLFALSHWWSYRSNAPADIRRTLSLNYAMGLPIARLLPLYLVVAAVQPKYVYAESTVVVWMLAKTLVDVGIHIAEHHHQAPRRTG